MTVQYKPIQSKTILHCMKFPDRWFHCKCNLNPYRGCEHACTYCDARFEKYGHTDLSKILVKQNAPQLLRKELWELSKHGKVVICMSGVCDPYQPAEKKFEITRKCLRVIKEYNFPVQILTKSDLVLRDLKLLKEISEKQWCVVSFTITSLDKNLVELLEPRSPRPEKRLKAMKTISKQGILTGVIFTPIVPFLEDNDGNIESVVKASVEHGANYLLAWGGMTLRGEQKEFFMNFLKNKFPDLLEKYEELFGSNPSPNKEYSEKIFNRVKFFCEKYRIPMKIPKPKIEKYVQTKLL